MPTTYSVNLQDIFRQPPTIGESRDLSRIGGLSPVELGALNLATLRAEAMIAVVYVLIRRQVPTFTEREMNGLNWDDIDFVQDGGAEADPPGTPPASKPGGRKSSARSVTTTG